MAFELVRLLQAEEPSGAAIERILQRDPLLAAQTIRFAHSAAMGARAKIVSLNDAILAIGYASLARFVLANAISKMAIAPLRVYDLSPEQFYRKSLACAIAMDYLQGASREPGGHAYTIGLLHAVGELFIDRYLMETQDEELVFQGVNARNLALLERRFAGLSQAEAAALALREWGLPESVVNPIRWQFDTPKAGEQAELAEALATSRYLASLAIEEERGKTRAAAAAKHLVYKGKSLGKLYELIKEGVAQMDFAA